MESFLYVGSPQSTGDLTPGAVQYVRSAVTYCLGFNFKNVQAYPTHHTQHQHHRNPWPPPLQHEEEAALTMLSRIPLVVYLHMVFMWGTSVVSFVPRQPDRAFRPRHMSTNGEADATDMEDVGFVLLAGGTGSRMRASMPKQFLPLKGVPVLHYSLDLFLERLPAHAAEQGLR